MTRLAKVQIPSFVITMSNHWWEELKMAKKNACSCSHPMWKLTSCNGDKSVTNYIMGPYVLIIMAQRNKWIPIRLMGCVHTHQGRPAIEGCGSISRVWSVVKKIGEDNQKVEKIGRITSQMHALRLEHDKIQAWWASSIPSKSMLKKVWWCKFFKMESWKWTICCSMSCSKGWKNTRARVVKDNVLLWSVVGKGRCCWLRLQKRKDISRPWT
jgi:hypothetical protein